MRSLSIVLVALQVFHCYCQNPYSAVSCAVGFYDHLTAFNDHRLLIRSSHDESAEANIHFKLYTKEHKNGFNITFQDSESLKNAGFKSERPTRIITHGYFSNGIDPVCIEPMKAFLEVADYNVIVMDWYKYQLAGNPFPIYSDITKKVKPAGRHLAAMINFLVEHGMDLKTTSLIGHSLGAHVVGIAGYNLETKIHHVVGLDPAEPDFETARPGDRISVEDAHHVEIIHTNGNNCGLLTLLGHYDFYPNGGCKQPGCKKNACAHMRAYEYYAESIRSLDGFYGKRCHDSVNVTKENCNGERFTMGGKTRNFILPGTYFVETNDKSPFAKGKSGW